MNKVLFVCTGNTCRSVMAFGIAAKLIGEGSVDCAGVSVSAARPPTENTILTLRDLGIDVSDYKSKSIRRLDLNEFKEIYVMEENHRKVLWQIDGSLVNKTALLDINNNNIPDPFGKPLSVYQTCRDVIFNNVKHRLGV